MAFYSRSTFVRKFSLVLLERLAGRRHNAGGFALLATIPEPLLFKCGNRLSGNSTVGGWLLRRNHSTNWAPYFASKASNLLTPFVPAAQHVRFIMPLR